MDDDEDEAEVELEPWLPWDELEAPEDVSDAADAAGDDTREAADGLQHVPDQTESSESEEAQDDEEMFLRGAGSETEDGEPSLASATMLNSTSAHQHCRRVSEPVVHFTSPSMPYTYWHSMLPWDTCMQYLPAQPLPCQLSCLAA